MTTPTEKVKKAIDDGLDWAHLRIDALRGVGVRRLKRDDQRAIVFHQARRVARIIGLLREQLLVLETLPDDILDAERRTDQTVIDMERARQAKHTERQLLMLTGAMLVEPCGQCGQTGWITVCGGGPGMPDAKGVQRILCPACGGKGFDARPCDPQTGEVGDHEVGAA